jgi:hypothetical protein
MRSALLSKAVYFTFVSAQTIISQAPTTPNAPASETEAIHRLNERIAAQDERLAAQQAQINALQSGFAEQKVLIDKLLQSADRPSPALQAASISRAQEDASLLTESVAALRNGTTAAFQPAVIKQQQHSTPVLKVQTEALNAQKEQPHPKEPEKWFDKYSIRGYMQFRENNVINTNSKYTCDQCDKSIGPNDKFFLRRMRVVISGNVNDRVYIYLQPDFASSTSSGDTNNLAQLRDAYFDVALDSEKKNRFRTGLSKVPYGFDNLQSSQNRLDFDRDDAINSCCSNERDIGITYYWARPYIRERLAELVSSGLKGSGDYGEFGLGMYNGETLNVTSANEHFHYVSRYTYPFKLRNGQFIETSIQGYWGKYTVQKLSSSTITRKDALYDDNRIALSLIVYPQPIGFQTEYNWGTGPEYNPANKTIEQKALNGGYALLNYRARPFHGVIFHPYSRLTYYDGGKKFEQDARKYRVIEGDFGIETQFGKSFELTPQYQQGYRLFEDGGKPNNQQKGTLLRMQLQYNY